MKENELVLELTDVHKRFGGVVALDGASLKLRSGEIHMLVGENGAGKSTMIKIMTGVHQPEKGNIKLEGKEITLHSPRDALAKGIVAIYQHATVYPHLSVTENIFMGHEEVSKKTKRLLWKNMHVKAQGILDRLGANFKSTDIVSELSVAQQQMVEIAKALSVKAKIIIMDEPTASLTKSESEELYKITETLKYSNVAVLFVSHRFSDIYRLADKVTVFRDSKYINTWSIEDIDEKALTFAMVGREIQQLYNKKLSDIGNLAMRVENLSSVGLFKNVSFELRYGEILGFTGLVGAGRSELFQSILGLHKISSGSIYVDEKQVNISHPVHAFDLGIAYLPEDRHIQGAFLNWSLTKNVTVSSLELVSKHSYIIQRKENELANAILKELNVKATSIQSNVSSLSGGNQQKVILGKLLVKNSKIMILDEPTKGIDIGAKSAIYEIMTDFVERGYAIVLISSEMPEILGMSDRIIVMREGRISKVLDNKSVSQEMLLQASMSTTSGGTS